MLKEDPTIAFGDWYSKVNFLKESGLYECLDVMPKPAVHHIHLTAGVEIDFVVNKILYYDYVYFNQKENMFKVNKNGGNVANKKPVPESDVAAVLNQLQP